MTITIDNTIAALKVEDRFRRRGRGSARAQVSSFMKLRLPLRTVRTHTGLPAVLLLALTLLRLLLLLL